MAEHPIKDVMETTLGKIRDMVDANTVVGNPIAAGDGTVILPVAKISLGFASGGSDLPTNTKANFGGGGGAGLKVQPVAFLVITTKGDVRLMEISNGMNTTDKAVAMVPEMFDKIAGLVSDAFGKKKEEKEQEQA